MLSIGWPTLQIYSFILFNCIKFILIFIIFIIKWKALSNCQFSSQPRTKSQGQEIPPWPSPSKLNWVKHKWKSFLTQEDSWMKRTKQDYRNKKLKPKHKRQLKLKPPLKQRSSTESSLNSVSSPKDPSQRDTEIGK